MNRDGRKAMGEGGGKREEKSHQSQKSEEAVSFHRDIMIPVYTLLALCKRIDSVKNLALIVL